MRVQPYSRFLLCFFKRFPSTLGCFSRLWHYTVDKKYAAKIACIYQKDKIITLFGNGRKTCKTTVIKVLTFLGKRVMRNTCFTFICKVFRYNCLFGMHFYQQTWYNFFQKPIFEVIFAAFASNYEYNAVVKSCILCFFTKICRIQFRFPGKL